MNNIKIVGNGIYLPTKKVFNNQLENKFNVPNGYIYSRTGIEQRYYADNEEIEQLAINAVKNLINRYNISKNKIEMIVVATTTTNKLMPGISCLLQKKLNIEKCVSLDILAGCSGYINGFDVLQSYIALGKVNNGIVVGVDVLSKYTDNTDIATAVILSDGAGATYIEKCNKKKLYSSCIQNKAENCDILVCNNEKKICMNGKEVYKYAVTQTVECVQNILKKNSISLEEIKYIIPHQSNIKIIKSIATRLNIDISKMYTNINKIGNTFCASIPIALSEMYDKQLLESGDKIILLGYGGGLNTGCILMEV